MDFLVWGSCSLKEGFELVSRGLKGFGVLVCVSLYVLMLVRG